MYEQFNCGKCVHNGIWDDKNNKYIYKNKLKDGEERTEAQDNGTCDMDDNFGYGCWMNICTVCGRIEIIPRVEN